MSKWFAEWRLVYGDSYRDAWGGLGLVAAWEFWARLEAIGWDPISVCLFQRLQIIIMT